MELYSYSRVTVTIYAFCTGKLEQVVNGIRHDLYTFVFHAGVQ